MDALLAIVFGYILLRFTLPFLSAFADTFKDEMKRIDREGLIKTDGAFWSPNQDIHPKRH